MKTPATTETKGKTGMQLEGVVMSDKMQLTAVVSVTRFVKHPKYGKFVKINKRYKAHNPENQYKIGDRVRMQSVRPMSKDKHFLIMEKIGHTLIAQAEPEATEIAS